LRNPLLIAGFDGWTNALNVANGMVAYLIRKLEAKCFASIDPDIYYRFDENRPIVDIHEGRLKKFSPPGGSFHAFHADSDGHDLVILKADEPNLRWFHFVDELLSLCQNLGIDTIITLGSMYDAVLHTDRVISGVASTSELISQLRRKNVTAISYQGPSSIHSVIQSQGVKRGFECISLWSHCPYYLQGTIHSGVMVHLGALLSSLVGFDLDTGDLQENWEKLNEQLQKLLETNMEFKEMVDGLRRSKAKDLSDSIKATMNTADKIINLKDFLDLK
jgi:proteasome assembly chaperone (PAC2) family protein